MSMTQLVRDANLVTSATTMGATDVGLLARLCLHFDVAIALAVGARFLANHPGSPPVGLQALPLFT